MSTYNPADLYMRRAPIASGLILLGIIALFLLATTGCGTMRYGDGRVGPVALDPAVGRLSDAMDQRFPGSGELVRGWFADAKLERVPPGWEVVWDSYLPDGTKIDRGSIRDVPRLQPKAEAAAVVVATSNSPPSALDAFEATP